MINQLQSQQTNLENLKMLYFDDGDATFVTAKAHEFVERLNCLSVYIASKIKDSIAEILRPLIFDSKIVENAVKHCARVSYQMIKKCKR